MKLLIIPGVSILLGLTVFAHNNAVLKPILGLAWDCGAVTTGPVTVPLVLALGIGVCRIVGDAETSNAGFGIVTLASLLPILAVLSLGIYHYAADDYYGRPNYVSTAEAVVEMSGDAELAETQTTEAVEFSTEEFERIVASGVVDIEHRLRYRDGEMTLEDGRIVMRDTTIIVEKVPEQRPRLIGGRSWDPNQNVINRIGESIVAALRAIISLRDYPLDVRTNDGLCWFVGWLGRDGHG